MASLCAMTPWPASSPHLIYSHMHFSEHSGVPTRLMVGKTFCTCDESASPNAIQHCCPNLHHRSPSPSARRSSALSRHATLSTSSGWWTRRRSGSGASPRARSSAASTPSSTACIAPSTSTRRRCSSASSAASVASRSAARRVRRHDRVMQHSEAFLVPEGCRWQMQHPKVGWIGRTM